MKKYRRIKGKISRGLYYARCWLFDRHNVIKLKHLPPTWIDRSELLMEVMFQILKDYVEKEKPFDFIDWEYTEVDRKDAKKIRAAYNWIIHDRKFAIEAENKILSEWASLQRKLRAERNIEEFKQLPNGNFEYISVEDLELEKLFDIVKETEEYRERKDDEMLQNILDVRKRLWT